MPSLPRLRGSYDRAQRAVASDLVVCSARLPCSSVIHMLSPWHKNDYARMPNEDAVMDALRPLAIPPGDYMVPRPVAREDLRSAAFAEKLAKGPVFV